MLYSSEKKRYKFEFLQHPNLGSLYSSHEQTNKQKVSDKQNHHPLIPCASRNSQFPPKPVRPSVPTEPGLPRRRRPTHSRCRRPIASRRVARVRGNCPKSHQYRARVINLLTAQNRARPRRHRAESRRSKPPASPRFARAGLPAAAALGSSDQGRGGELGFHRSRASASALPSCAGGGGWSRGD